MAARSMTATIGACLQIIIFAFGVSICTLAIGSFDDSFGWMTF
jgi:hypothetical protein